MYDVGIWPQNISLALATCALGYFLGSIPFGLILVKLAGHGDIRNVGSGNIGATNVLRAGGKCLAGLTLFLDASKAVAAIYLADYYHVENIAFAAMGALLGHIFPFGLRFRGGKGVATYLGIAIALYWRLGLTFAAVWLLTAIIGRYSSLSGILACIITPLAAWKFAGSSTGMLFTVMSLIVIAKHDANIRRLLSGEESKIGGGTRRENTGE